MVEILGEIGSGKVILSSSSLATLRARKKKAIMGRALSLYLLMICTELILLI